MKKLVKLTGNAMRTILSLFLVVLSLFGPIAALAETSPYLSLTPAVIDEKAKQRDIINESVTLTNTSDHVLTLYPSVYDVNTVNGQEVFSYAKDASDLAASLANWIELSRGVIDLAPGQTKAVPFTMRVNLNAKPGQYHAQVSFGEGGTREEAESKRSLMAVSVNLEVLADIKEIMQLSSFSSDNIVLAGDDVVFKYKVQNIGNQELQPSGEIRIFNRKGEEVASVDVNKSGKSIAPDKDAQLASVWSGASGFGKFKALLTVNYGKGQTAAVQDTVFFWIIPWKQLLGLIAASLIAVAFFALHFQRWFEERHLNKLAVAGLLRTHHIGGVPVVAFPVDTKVAGASQPMAAPERRPSKVLAFSKTVANSFGGLLGYVRRGRSAAPFVPTFSAFDMEQPQSRPKVPEKPALREVLPPRKEVHQAEHSISLRPQIPAQTSGTIDLKKLRPHGSQQMEETGPGHVINLKKRS